MLLTVIFLSTQETYSESLLIFSSPWKLRRNHWLNPSILTFPHPHTSDSQHLRLTPGPWLLLPGQQLPTDSAVFNLSVLHSAPPTPRLNFKKCFCQQTVTTTLIVRSYPHTVSTLFCPQTHTCIAWSGSQPKIGCLAHLIKRMAFVQRLEIGE